MRGLGVLIKTAIVLAAASALAAPCANADHRDHALRTTTETDSRPHGTAHTIPGAPFHVFAGPDLEQDSGREQAAAAVRAVVDAFAIMLRRPADYPRFEESLKKQALQYVAIEPTVRNQEGKTFPFLVARTDVPGRVKLLISASALKEQGYLGNPERLVPALAREFQWVVSKADTAPKAKAVPGDRDLARARIRSDEDIRNMAADERVRNLRHLFGAYLRTVDDHNSLQGQPYYEVGTTTLVPPSQPDSTTKLYDIRVREALERIVRDPYFEERTPRAVRSLLNGAVWNVAFVKIEQRDWATRTRVLPEDKAVVVGTHRLRIQPAAVLINTYRTAAPDDPFYRETKNLPMGALAPDQLARVIAMEIEHNIIEKSMRGHVAQDETTAPK